MSFLLRGVGVVFVGLLALIATPGWGQDRVPELAKVSRRGVALLKGYANGQSITGTGFLIDSRTIITNAHVVQGANTIFAEFDGGEKIDCSLIDLDVRADLAALCLDQPLENRSLLRRKGVMVVQGERVVLIGHPLGLKWSVHEGRVAAIRTLGEIAEELRLPRPANPGQKAIQLDITSTQGMSGAPVLNSEGDIIGIQKEGWKDGLGGINFCIPQESVDLLDLKKRPRKFVGEVRTLQDDFQKVGLQSQRLSQPEFRVDDRKVEIGCQHWGYIHPNADFIFANYVGDKGRFGTTMPKFTVQEILNRHRVVHVTNSAFGLSFLVPDNYELSQIPQRSPLGLQITLTNRDARVPFFLRAIYIRAALIQPAQEVPALMAKVREVAESFARDTLKLRIHDPSTRFTPNGTEQDVVMIFALTDREPRITPAVNLARYHVTYSSMMNINKSWNIYAAVNGQTATVTAYQYITQSTMPGMAADSAERQFIAETLSFDGTR